jgi:hypothetical protein
MEIGIIIIAVIYFAPFIVAYTRNTVDKGIVFWFNVFGFTGVGYAIAAVMAFTSPVKTSTQQKETKQ